MAPKHPYLNEAEKAVFLEAIDNGENIAPAARKQRLISKQLVVSRNALT